MNAIIRWAKGHPTQAVALLALAVTTAIPFLPTALGLFLGGALSIIIGKPLHEIVTPVATAAENVTRAATEAAVQVARDLDETVVGTTGTVTVAAEHVVDKVIDGVVGRVLGGVK